MTDNMTQLYDKDDYAKTIRMFEHGNPFVFADVQRIAVETRIKSIANPDGSPFNGALDAMFAVFAKYHMSDVSIISILSNTIVCIADSAEPRLIIKLMGGKICEEKDSAQKILSKIKFYYKGLDTDGEQIVKFITAWDVVESPICSSLFIMRGQVERRLYEDRPSDWRLFTTWRPLAVMSVKPSGASVAKENVSVWCKFFYNAICKHDNAQYKWLMHWIRAVFEEVPTRHALMLNGPQGAGKTTCFELLELVLGNGKTYPTNLDQVASRFNVKTSGLNYITEVDGQHQNARADYEKLKARITNHSIIVEPKYGVPHEQENTANYMMDSNNPQAISPDDRRYAVYKVDYLNKDSIQYWTELSTHKTKQAARDFYDYLISHYELVDQKWFIANFPKSDARADMIDNSRNSASRFATRIRELRENYGEGQVLPVESGYQYLQSMYMLPHWPCVDFMGEAANGGAGGYYYQFCKREGHKPCDMNTVGNGNNGFVMKQLWYQEGDRKVRRRCFVLVEEVKTAQTVIISAPDKMLIEGLISTTESNKRRDIAEQLRYELYCRYAGLDSKTLRMMPSVALALAKPKLEKYLLAVEENLNEEVGGYMFTYELAGDTITAGPMPEDLANLLYDAMEAKILRTEAESIAEQEWKKIKDIASNPHNSLKKAFNLDNADELAEFAASYVPTRLGDMNNYALVEKIRSLGITINHSIDKMSIEDIQRILNSTL